MLRLKYHFFTSFSYFLLYNILLYNRKVSYVFCFVNMPYVFIYNVTTCYEQ